MSRQGVGSVIVVADGRPLGIVTDRDLRRKVVAEARDANGVRCSLDEYGARRFSNVPRRLPYGVPTSPEERQTPDQEAGASNAVRSPTFFS
jgi:hypothetical protein